MGDGKLREIPAFRFPIRPLERPGRILRHHSRRHLRGGGAGGKAAVFGDGAGRRSGQRPVSAHRADAGGRRHPFHSGKRCRTDDHLSVQRTRQPRPAGGRPGNRFRAGGDASGWRYPLFPHRQSAGALRFHHQAGYSAAKPCRHWRAKPSVPAPYPRPVGRRRPAAAGQAEAPALGTCPISRRPVSGGQRVGCQGGGDSPRRVDHPRRRCAAERRNAGRSPGAAAADAFHGPDRALHRRQPGSALPAFGRCAKPPALRCAP